MLDLFWMTVQLTFWLLIMGGIAITAAAGILAPPAAASLWLYRRARARYRARDLSPTEGAV